MGNNSEKENIWNLANFLTLCRVIIALITIYLIFAGFSVVYIIISFVVGMLTDCLDGFVARRLNIETEFGRRFDMVADRILIVGVGLAVVIKFSMAGILTKWDFCQMLFLLSREILTIPVALVTMIIGAGIPQVRRIGKTTTLLQSIVFPMLLLSIFYTSWSFAVYFVIITGIIGFISGIYYITDMRKLVVNRLKQQPKVK